MKGRIALIIISAFIITSCDFLFKEDEKDYPYPPYNQPISGVSITPSEPFVGDNLTAETSPAGFGLVYRWERSDTENGERIWVGEGSSYIPLMEDKEKYIRVTVSYDYRPGSLTSKAVYVGVRSLAGSVSIKGNAVEGETLTADTDSLEGTGYISYQWERAVTPDTTEWMPYGDYYTNRYYVRPEDVGKYIRLTVTSSYNTGSITSEPTAAVTFNISGTASVDRTLSFSSYNYNESENFGYQWERADTADGAWIAIGDNTSGYTIDEADLGKYIRLTITRADNTSIHSKVVGPVILSPLTGTVSIIGDAAIGATLRADTSLYGTGTITYQWERWDVVSNTLETIGDNSPVYTVVAEDKGKRIQVTVTYSRNTGSITSNKTNPIGLPPLGGSVSVSGTFNVDNTLTANTGNLGGSGEISYQWQRRSSSSSSASPTNIGSNSPTYTITDEDVGKYVGVTVTRADNSGSISSAFNSSAITNNLIGTVSIIGDAVIGATLTVDTSLLKGTGTITYQWRSNGTTVGGNASTYIIRSTDFDKTISVRVSRSDRTNSVDSPQTAQVCKPQLTGTVSISGTAAVGERLTAATASLEGSGTITYQWQLGDAANGPWTNIGSNLSYYTPVLAQEGQYIRLTVTRADNADSVSSEAVGPIIKLQLTGTVSINGTVAVNQILTAGTSLLMGSGTISYQWERADTATGPWETIGSNSNNYQLVGADFGKYIRLTVSRANNTGTVSSAATSAVAIPILTGTVSISGVARQDETLTAVTDNLGGTSNPWGSGAITYQWQRGNTANASAWTEVGSGTSYSLTSADVGRYIRLTVSRDGYSGSVYSTTSAVTLPLLTGTISISGTAKAGETLTAVTGSLGGSGNITYDWQRGDTANASAWTYIGSNSATYIPVASDAGKYIRLTVTRSGNSGSITSNVTSAVTIDAISGTVTISGTPKGGSPLTAGIGSLRGTVSYQWQKASSANASTWTNIGSNSATYIPSKADQGTYIRVMVSSNYYTGNLTSSPTSSAVTIDPLTGTVTIEKPYLDRPYLYADTSKLGGSGAITYKWERCVTATLGFFGAWEDLHESGSSYTFTPLQLFSYYRVTVTTANNSGEVVSDWKLVLGGIF